MPNQQIENREIVHQILEPLLELEEKNKKNINQNMLKEGLVNLKRMGMLHKDTDITLLSKKTIETKKAITFLKNRIAVPVGMITEKRMMEKAQQISNFKMETLSDAISFLNKERSKHIPPHVICLPFLFTEIRASHKAIPKNL